MPIVPSSEAWLPSQTLSTGGFDVASSTRYQLRSARINVLRHKILQKPSLDLRAELWDNSPSAVTVVKTKTQALRNRTVELLDKAEQCEQFVMDLVPSLPFNSEGDAHNDVMAGDEESLTVDANANDDSVSRELELPSIEVEPPKAKNVSKAVAPRSIGSLLMSAKANMSNGMNKPSTESDDSDADEAQPENSKERGKITKSRTHDLAGGGKPMKSKKALDSSQSMPLNYANTLAPPGSKKPRNKELKKSQSGPQSGPDKQNHLSSAKQKLHNKVEKQDKPVHPVAPEKSPSGNHLGTQPSTEKAVSGPVSAPGRPPHRQSKRPVSPRGGRHTPSNDSWGQQPKGKILFETNKKLGQGRGMYSLVKIQEETDDGGFLITVYIMDLKKTFDLRFTLDNWKDLFRYMNIDEKHARKYDILCSKLVLVDEKSAAPQVKIDGYVPKVEREDPNAVRVSITGDLRGMFGGAKKHLQEEEREMSEMQKRRTVKEKEDKQEKELSALCKRHGLYRPFLDAVFSKFGSLDKSGDGQLSQDEFVTLVQWITRDDQTSGTSVKRMWNEFDSKKKDGAVDFEEFLVWFLKQYPHFKEMSTRELNQFLSSGF